MKTAFFAMSNICTEERLEARMCEEAMKAAGWVITKNFKDADLILIYTCAVFAKREDASIKLIEEFQRKKRRNQEIIVCGCLPKINQERLRAIFNGRSFGPREADDLRKILGAESRSRLLVYNEIDKDDQWYFYHRKIVKGFENMKRFFKTCCATNIFPACHIPKLITNDDSFYILIGIGCMGTCSFCAVRYAKGLVKSKPIEEIIEEFECGLRLGYKRFFLCADDLGYYGNDRGTDLAELLEHLLKKNGDFEINLREVSPDCLLYLLPKLKTLFATGKIKSITAAVQSGSNRILQLMGRRYSIEQYKYCISQLREAYPPLLVRTAIMIGFPTESDADFKATFNLLDEIDFDMVDIFRYSNRPNTEAARYQNQVAEFVKYKRALLLRLKALRKILF